MCACVCVCVCACACPCACACTLQIVFLKVAPAIFETYKYQKRKVRVCVCVYIPKNIYRHSWVDNAGRSSLGDINGGTTELDSAGSSPGVQRVFNNFFITYFNVL